MLLPADLDLAGKAQGRSLQRIRHARVLPGVIRQHAAALGPSILHGNGRRFADDLHPREPGRDARRLPARGDHREDRLPVEGDLVRREHGFIAEMGRGIVLARRIMPGDDAHHALGGLHLGEVEAHQPPARLGRKAQRDVQGAGGFGMSSI